MAFVRSGLLAVGLRQLLVVAASEASTDTCDLATGTCSTDADDTMSAMQLRGEVQGEKKGDYWKLIPASLEGYDYPKSTDKNPVPPCFQGIMYMDQQCLTYDKMPEEDQATPCLGRAPPYMWVNEYTTTFGNWNPKTRCFRAERVGWTFGDSKSAEAVCSGIGIEACQENAWKHPDPCEVGAKYGSTNMGMFKWYIQRTNSGWSRITPYWFPLTTKYPVHQIVDGNGNKTKWFQTYYNEAMQKTCKSDAKSYGGPKGCRKSEWAAQDKIAVCTASSGEAKAVVTR